MMKRKIISVILSLSIIAPTSISVFAAETDNYTFDGNIEPINLIEDNTVSDMFRNAIDEGKRELQLQSIEGLQDLVSGASVQLYTGQTTFPNATGHDDATDGDSTTFFTTGKLLEDSDGGKGGQIFPLFEVPKDTRYNVIRLKYDLPKVGTGAAGLRLWTSGNKTASSQFKDIIPTNVIKFSDYETYDNVIKFPAQDKPYIGFHFNTYTSADRYNLEFKLYDFEVYYDGTLLDKVEVPESVAIDSENETRIPLKAINADGQEMTDISQYEWTGEALSGCENVYVDSQTNELVIPSNSQIGEYTVKITNKDNNELFVTSNISILPDPDNWQDLFNKINGSKSISIPDSGSEDHVYKIFDALDQESSVNSEVQWSLSETPTGVTFNGNTLTVSSEAVECKFKIIAEYDGHTLEEEITLKKSLYGDDLVSGQSVQLYTGQTTFLNVSGLDAATDGDTNTFFTTGKLKEGSDNGKGGQIFPLFEVPKDTKYNTIRLKYELVKGGASPGLRLWTSGNKTASSQFIDIIPTSVIKFGDYENYDNIVRFATQTKPYIGFHFNTYTSAERYNTEFKLYDFEVYYDKNLLSEIKVDDLITIDRGVEKRYKVSGINAEGNVMDDVSSYNFTATPLIGCEGVTFDDTTKEIVVPVDANIGQYSITVTHKESPELTFTKVVNIMAPEDEMEQYFNHISGLDTVLIPPAVVNTVTYKVEDIDGVSTEFTDVIKWELAQEYKGVTQTNGVISVATDAVEQTVQLIAKIGNYSISKDIVLKYPSQPLKEIVSSIEGQKFVVAPYFGEQEYTTAQYSAKSYDLNDIKSGVTWSLQGAPEGVSIDPNTGVLSVPANTPDAKIKVVATCNDISVDRLITIVSRYTGAPNLVRIDGTSVNDFATTDTLNTYDGDFSTKSTNEVSKSSIRAKITFNQKYRADVMRVYRDNTHYENSAQTSARYDNDSGAMGGKGWSNSPLEADIWTNIPHYETDNITYSFYPKVDPIMIYEMEVYSTMMRFNRVESDTDIVEIPGSGSNTLQMRAINENGDEVQNVTYADGEEHKLKWDILTPTNGVSIDENTGVLTVTSSASPTTVTVRGIYFGKVETKAIRIGKVSDSATLAKMDYDWLTFDKLSIEKPENITYKMMLFNEGPSGSAITWESSNGGTISTTGEVTLPYATTDQNVTLTATIKNGNSVLTKTFDCVVKRPADFIDKNIVTDRELFGLWDWENGVWAIEPMLDYSKAPMLSQIEEAVKNLNYAVAEELLYDYTKQKLLQLVDTVNPSTSYSSANVQLYMNSTSTYTINAIGTMMVGNEEKWYNTNVKPAFDASKKFTITLHGTMKEDSMAVFSSRESENKPYILVKMKNGNEMRFEPYKDTTLRAGKYIFDNYGSEDTLRVMDSGYPIDSDTQRGILTFDLSSIENENDVSSVELYLYGSNVTKTGDKKVSVLYDAKTEWEENSYCWYDTNKSAGLFSYSGVNGGFELSYPPGADPECLLNPIGRIYHLHNIASGFPMTKDERYAYTAFDLLDNFDDRAGDNNSYPRGFDGYERNNRFMSSYKLLANSQYMTSEMTTRFWKHMWEFHDHMARDNDPFFNEVDNMMISTTNMTLKVLSDFNEFKDAEKWIDKCSERLTPLFRRVIFPDGSYSEGSDGYADGSIQTLASSVEAAEAAGIGLGAEIEERMYKCVYFYADMKLPNHQTVGYGDNNSTGEATTKVDNFLARMATLYNDDQLKYISANGNNGGTKPDYTSRLYPDTNRLYMRAAWSDGAPYLMTSLDDSYGSHSHTDDLAVATWAYGNFLTPDTGRYNYTWSDPVNIELLSSKNHNTLGRITDLTDNTEYIHDSAQRKDENKVNYWTTNEKYDYFSGTLREDLYSSGEDKRNTSFTRKIFFVKPDYWIISDYVNDKENGGDVKYDFMYHLLPDSGYTLDNENKVVKTNFTNKTNVQLLSPDSDVEISRETGIYCPISGSYTTTDRIVFSKTEKAGEDISLNTVMYPLKAGSTANVTTQSIATDLPKDEATAMQINRSDKDNNHTDYFYSSNAKLKDSESEFSKAKFGDFEFDGEMAFASYNNNSGKLEAFTVVNGTRFAKNSEDIVTSENMITDLSAYFENGVLYLYSSADNLNQFGSVVIESEDSVSKVIFNGKETVYSQYNGQIVVGGNTFIVDTTVQTSPEGEEYIELPAINYGDNFEYDGEKYLVNVTIPENTKIRPIENWDGKFKIEITSENVGDNAGTVSIKTVDGDVIEFMTPISIYVPQHSSADVSMTYNGKTSAVVKELSSNSTDVSLDDNSAGIYTLRDHLWIITNVCELITVSKIEIPILPPGGGGSGGGSGGGGGGGGGVEKPTDEPTEQPTDKPVETDKPEPTDKPSYDVPFTDLNGFEWADEAIEYLYGKKIIDGVSDTEFAPSSNVTRSQFVTILVRAFDLKSDNTLNVFDDVEEGQWYTDAIKIAYGLGIVNGIDDNTFGINNNITRQDMMVMLYRTIKYLNIELELTHSMDDVTDYDTVDDYAKEAVSYMYQAGIINGMGNGEIAPKLFAQRAQAAKIIYEVIK